MCFHRRVVYGCHHHRWGAIYRPCKIEESFENGSIDIGCSQMWSHGMCTTQVQKDCKLCAKGKTETDAKLLTVKKRIRKLRENLDTRVEKPDKLVYPGLESPGCESENGDGLSSPDELEVLSEIGVEDIISPPSTVQFGDINWANESESRGDDDSDSQVSPRTMKMMPEVTQTPMGYEEDEKKTGVEFDPILWQLYLPVLVKLSEEKRGRMIEKVTQ